jgi:hypothetical protein
MQISRQIATSLSCKTTTKNACITCKIANQIEMWSMDFGANLLFNYQVVKTARSVGKQVGNQQLMVRQSGANVHVALHHLVAPRRGTILILSDNRGLRRGMMSRECFK